MGRVHLTWDRALRRELAMKTIRRDRGHAADGEATLLGRFLGEARVTSRLDHPGMSQLVLHVGQGFPLSDVQCCGETLAGKCCQYTDYRSCCSPWRHPVASVTWKLAFSSLSSGDRRFDRLVKSSAHLFLEDCEPHHRNKSMNIPSFIKGLPKL